MLKLLKFKFLYEYSAFVGPNLKKSPFKCYAIDEKMNKIAGLIRKKMPTIGEDEMIRLLNKKMSRYHAIYDINRRIAQNISNSLHRRTKMRLMGFGKDETSERLRLYFGYVMSREEGTTKYKCSKEDAQLLQNIAMVEHERWIVSHKLMGYTYNPVNDCVQKHHK